MPSPRQAPKPRKKKKKFEIELDVPAAKPVKLLGTSVDLSQGQDLGESIDSSFFSGSPRQVESASGELPDPLLLGDDSEFHVRQGKLLLKKKGIVYSVVGHGPVEFRTEEGRLLDPPPVDLLRDSGNGCKHPEVVTGLEDSLRNSDSDEDSGASSAASTPKQQTSTSTSFEPIRPRMGSGSTRGRRHRSGSDRTSQPLPSLQNGWTEELEGTGSTGSLGSLGSTGRGGESIAAPTLEGGDHTIDLGHKARLTLNGSRSSHGDTMTSVPSLSALTTPSTSGSANEEFAAAAATAPTNPPLEASSPLAKLMERPRKRSSREKSDQRRLQLSELPELDRRIDRKEFWNELKLINTVLGTGSQAEVRMVMHQTSKTQYAMKVIELAKGCQDTPGSIEKTLHRELSQVLHTATTSQCPFLTKSYEAYFKKTKVYILMEFMGCGSLEYILSRSPGRRLPEREAAIVTHHVLQGLKFLHGDAQLIHRDIKPSNLLVNREGQVKIGDFGISTFADSMGNKESSTGTRMFMSPERIQIQSYSYPSDIWSLGLTTAQCLLGEFPFQSSQYENLFLMMTCIAKGRAQVSWPEGCDVSQEAREFVRLCTATDPRDRPSAADLLSHPFVVPHRGGSLVPYLKDVMPRSCFEGKGTPSS